VISIQTNVNSLVAQQNLSVNTAFQAKTIQQLTSGYRINSSGDDAAGLAVANKYRNSVAELTQGVANGNDGVASLQIMDSGMSNIGVMLDRLKVLAMQSSSDGFSGGVTGRATLNTEFQTDIAEIDRQAQSIGLNSGGTFAKSLSIYLGAGSGSTSAANAVVNVDLSKSTVDTQSLGLKGTQAVNSNTYDLSNASATSVHAILNDTANGATGSSVPVASTGFTFFGAGFSNADGATSNLGVTLNVNLAGVGDTKSLVDAVNAAIQVEAQKPTGQASAFKAANIQASVITDATGNQKLAFSSATVAFEAQANDKTSNALTGNFAADGTSAATGAEMGVVITGKNTVAVGGTGSTLGVGDLSVAANNVTLTINGAGFGSAKTVLLNHNYSNSTTYADNTAIAADINTQFTNAGITGVTVSATAAGPTGKLVFTSTAANGAITVSASGLAASVATLGLGKVAGTSGTGSSGTVATTTSYSTTVSGGAYEMASTSSGSTSVTNLKFATAIGATHTQAISITGADATGGSHLLTVALDNTSGATIASAVGKINDSLQKSNDATLQQITAVAVNENGQTKINFVSTLNNFSVALGSAGVTGTFEGLTDSSGAQGTTLKGVQVGSGGSADISTVAGAQAAVTAISKAVSALGSAQAAIGRSQNQLTYAIALAQSQITNFSAAESQIRDTNVAQQAANLSKAQTLSQASIAAMAQANSAPQAVLSLLRG
jgi:flagellin